jgi:hypothetical protein
MSGYYDDTTRSVPPAAVAFIRNAFTPALVCLEAATGGAAGAQPEAAGDSLTPEVASARRALCLTALDDTTRSPLVEQIWFSSFQHTIGILAGSVLGVSFKEGLQFLTSPYLELHNDPRYGFPAELHMLYLFLDKEGDKRRAVESLYSDPYFGPIFRRRACRSCGLLPGDVTDKPFQACSLCLDPSVGRFCCKEPCFAEFWKGGHKKECAGRDKMKKKGKKGGGETAAGPSGGSAAS